MIEPQRPVAPESVTGRVAAIVAALAAQPRQSLTGAEASSRRRRCRS